MKKVLILFSLIFFFCFPLTVSATSHGWGFKKNDNHEQPYIGAYANEIKDTNSYYVGNKDEKIVYLTFDAGYDNGNMVKIIDILEKYDVEATFFITGDFLNRFSHLVKLISDKGHIVGNHTWSHKNITSLNCNELTKELEKVEDKYFEITNKVMDPFFRPPAGVFNRDSLKQVMNHNYNTIFWSIAYKDWDVSNQKGVDKAVNSVIDNLHNGAIILLHTVSNDNVLSLPLIIENIHNKGYKIVSLNNLICPSL